MAKVNLPEECTELGQLAEVPKVYLLRLLGHCLCILTETGELRGRKTW